MSFLFDGYFRKSADARTGPIGVALVRIGVTADLLTATGVLLSVCCAVLIGSGYLFWGFVLLVASSLPDLFDGPVAKAAGTSSERGAFLDSVCDRITDSVVLGGIAWYLADTQGGKIAILPFALLAVTQSLSYMRAKGELYGFESKGGLMERAERVVALCIGLVFSAALVPILWVMLALSCLTAIHRFFKIWRQATQASPAHTGRRRETPPWATNLFAAWNEADERRRRRWREKSDELRKLRRHQRSTGE